MSEEARIRINSHRLMQQHGQPVTEMADGDAARIRAAHARFMRHVWVHLGVFAVTFIFSAGLFVLGVIIGVRSSDLLPLVLLVLFVSAVFVVCFAGLRMLILHRLLDEYPDKEEDPGLGHHLGKSVAYAFLALVGAFILAGLLINNIAAAQLS